MQDSQFAMIVKYEIKTKYIFKSLKIFLSLQGALLDTAGVKSDLELGLQYDTEEVYESEVHVEDVTLGGDTVYFNVGLESESEHSEVLSLPSTAEETVTVTVLESFLFVQGVPKRGISFKWPLLL